MSQKSSSEIAMIGIDIGKNSFHVVGQDRRRARVDKIPPIAMLTARYNRIGRGRRVGRESGRNWTCKVTDILRLASLRLYPLDHPRKARCGQRLHPLQVPAMIIDCSRYISRRFPNALR